MTTNNKKNKVQAIIESAINKVWYYWTDSSHIIHWNNASEEWYSPRAENDLRPGGKFKSRMEARDGSSGFDLEGIYSEVRHLAHIAYTLEDRRKVTIDFKSNGQTTTVTETFEAENEYPVDMQREGWRAILNNFKQYVENKNKLETLHFNIHIDASVEQVYDTMIDEQTYRDWTSAFSTGSRYEGSWEKGAKIKFLGPGKNGNCMGMIGRIKENIPLEKISIEMLGFMEKGEENLHSPAAASSAGAREDYFFNNDRGATRLSIQTEISQAHKEDFLNCWPGVLEKLKTICENK